MSRNRQVIIYSIGFLFGSLASSKPVLSDRWIFIAFIGACICSLTWAAFEKLDQVKKGRPKREEPIEPINIDRTCPQCKGRRVIVVTQGNEMRQQPCYTCKGEGWVKVKTDTAA